MEFVEAPAFTRHVYEYLDEESFRALQAALILNPEAGDIMPATGGFRKFRWADPRRGKGKRGGLRVIYFYFDADQQIWLITVYSKDEAADLTPGQKRTLSAAIDDEKKARASKRLRR